MYVFFLKKYVNAKLVLDLTNELGRGIYRFLLRLDRT